MVLEAKFSNQGADNPGKRQLLCVVMFTCIFGFSTVIFRFFIKQFLKVVAYLIYLGKHF